MPRATNESRIRAACKMELHDVELLDLHNQEFDNMSGLEECIRLHTLFISYNGIKRLSSISDCPLWRLDASHNKLTSIIEMTRFAAFGFLDLSFNNLSVEEIRHLREVHVFSLSLQHNPELDRIPFRRKLLINLLPKVWILDGIFVTTKETREAYNFFARSLHRDFSTGVESLDIALKDPFETLFKNETWNENLAAAISPAILVNPLPLKIGMQVKARLKNKWFTAEVKKTGIKSVDVFFTTLHVPGQVAREDIDVLVPKAQAVELCGDRFDEAYFHEHKELVAAHTTPPIDENGGVLSDERNSESQGHILESALRLMVRICAPTAVAKKDKPARSWKSTATLHKLAQCFILLCQEEPMMPILRDGYRFKHIQFFLHTQASREGRFFRRLENASHVERAPNFMPRKILSLHADKLLRHLVARQWLDIGTLLVATLEFDIPRMLLQEALTLICLDCLSHQVMRELSQQHPYAITTTLFDIMSEALAGINVNTCAGDEVIGRYKFTPLEIELWKALMEWLGVSGPKLWVRVVGDKKKLRKLRARHAALLFNRAPSAPSLLSYAEEAPKSKTAAAAAFSDESSKQSIYARMFVLMQAADMVNDGQLTTLTTLGDNSAPQDSMDQISDDLAHVDAQWQEYEQQQEARQSVSAYEDEPRNTYLRQHEPRKGEIVRIGILATGKRRSASVHVSTIEKVFAGGNVGVANFLGSHNIAGPMPDRASGDVGELLVLRRYNLSEDPLRYHGAYTWVHHSLIIAKNHVAVNSKSIKPLHRTSAGYSGSGLQRAVNIPNQSIPIGTLDTILRKSGKNYTWNQVHNKIKSNASEFADAKPRNGRVAANMTPLQLFTINQKWDSHFVLAPKQTVDAQNTYAMAACKSPIADTWSSVDNGLVVSSLPEARTSAARLRVTTTAPIWVKHMTPNYRNREKWFSVKGKHTFTIASERYRPVASVRVVRRKPQSVLSSHMIRRLPERRSNTAVNMPQLGRANGITMPAKELSIMQKQSRKLRKLRSPEARLPPRTRFKDLGVA